MVRLEGQHSAPAAAAAIDTSVVDVTACMLLEHGLGDRHRQKVVFAGLDLIQVSESPEGLLLSGGGGRVTPVTNYLRADLTHSRFEEVDFSGSRFHNVYFTDTVIRGAWLQRVEIDGYLDDVTINGVDVGPLIEAELDRRDPDRMLVRPTDADGFRRAWDVVVRRWAAAVQRARALPENLLHERVDGEWSFIETLRHLVFATDAWLLRAVLGDPAPYHPLGLGHSEMPADTPGVPHDPDARPSLDEILAVRTDRMATVATVLDGLTDERLGQMTAPVLEPGYPESESFPVRRCLGAVVNEEWLHREYAERDLTHLEERSA